MGYILIAIAILILTIFFSMTGVRAQGKDEKGTKAESALIAENKLLERAKLKERLLMLVKSKPPDELATGAMCYAPIAPLEKIEYTCPKCGEKTLYKIGTVRDKMNYYHEINFIQHKLESCRRAAESIKAFGIELDESQFCRKCSPDVQSPELVLVVKYKGENKPYRVTDVTLDDLKLLDEFLSGSAKHTNDSDWESPLKNHAKRLSELLGIEIESIQAETEKE